MKHRPTHKDLPQTEGHPEPFPKVNTIPDGWDLSDLLMEAYNPEELFNTDPLDEETGSWNLTAL